MATTMEVDETSSNKKQFKSIVTGLINDPRKANKLSFADVVKIMKDYENLTRHLAELKLTPKCVDTTTEIPFIKVSDFSEKEDQSLLPEPSENWGKKSYYECLMLAGENRNYLKVPGNEYPMMKHKSFDAAYIHKFSKNTQIQPSTFSTLFCNERKVRPEKRNLKRRFSDGYKYTKSRFSSRPRLQSTNACALLQDQIYRLGQTKLFWRSMPTKESQGTLLANTSHRDQLTVLFCTNFTGSHKLQPLVVGSCSDPRVIQNFEAFVVYKHSKNAQITPTILNDWFFDHFIPEVSKHLKKLDLPQRAMLVMDPSVNRHPPLPQLISADHQIKAVKLSNNIAVDQTVVGLARVQYKKCLLLDAVTCPMKFTKLGDAIDLLRLAWDKVKPLDIDKCCRYILPEEDYSSFVLFNPTEMLRTMQLQKMCVMEIQELLTYFPGGHELIMTEIYNWMYFDEGFIINKNPFF